MTILSMRFFMRVAAVIAMAIAASLTSAQTMPRVPDGKALMNWAERTYPQFFPGRQADITSGTLTYRAYTDVGNYLGVMDSTVYIASLALTNGVPMALGELNSFACAVFPDSCAAPARAAQEQCLRFSSRQYAYGKAIIPANSAFTVAMWVYDISGNSGFVEYLSQGESPGPFYLGTTATSGVIRVGNAWNNTGVVMPQKKWTHLAVVREASGEGLLYLDGSLAAETPSMSFAGVARGELRLGSQFGTPGEYFTGCMDNVSVWNVARTAEQIKADMDNGVDLSDTTNLLAAFDFNEAVEPGRLWQAGSRSGNVLDMNTDRVDYLNTTEAAEALTADAAIVRTGGGLSNCVTQCGPHFSASYDTIPSGMRGLSWYSAVWPITKEATNGLQLGLASTWINSDLRALQNTQSPLIYMLCGASPFKADDLNGWGYSRWILWQSNEGGLGYWTSQSFRSAMPKFRPNATSDCYQNYTDSPGWSQFANKPTAQDKTGFVQLSNRLMIPPDGLTFPLNTNGEVLGQAWMALPWPTVAPTPAAPTGSNAWTLFLTAANFKGPIAYFMPHFWSIDSQRDPRIAGLGMDNTNLYSGSNASEWGAVPLLENKDAQGNTYGRIPDLLFPVDANGRTLLALDVYGWNNNAIAQPFVDWLADRLGTVSTFPISSATRIKLKVGQQPSLFQKGSPISNSTALYGLKAFDDGQSWGFEWPANGVNANRIARFPSYFKQTGNNRDIVDEASVPASTGLRAASFAYRDTTIASYLVPSPNWWGSDDPNLAGGSVTLTDGSRVTYRWYRFVDQPALMRLNLTSAEKQTLQSLVEKMHRTWPITADYQPLPSAGKLVSFDPALLVTPPMGKEVGYVPVVVGQTGSRLGPPLPFDMLKKLSSAEPAASAAR